MISLSWHLLQEEALNASPDWHSPFHLGGTGGIPSSSKLGDSGQIPAAGSHQHYNPAEILLN